MTKALAISAYGHHDRLLIRTLPRLLEKIRESDVRAVVLVAEDDLAGVDKGLWTYTPLGFLPHGSAAAGHPEHQPIWVTSTLENPNDARVLVVYDYSPEGIGDFASKFDRVLDLYRRDDRASTEMFHERLQVYRAIGANITAWRDDGTWNKDEDLIKSS